MSLLAVAAATAVAATSASPERVPLRMDARFSGFDIIAHVQRTHPALSGQAEAISHWAGYHSVNPILLGQLASALAAPDSAAIRGLARSLRAATDTPDTQRAPGRVTAGSAAQTLQQVLPMSTESAEAMLSLAWAEMSAAGLWRTQAVTADEPPALDLPFEASLRWQFNGVHTWTGNDDGTPMSSLDFAASWSQGWGADTSDEIVAAAHDGEVTVYSSCYVQVQHAGGWGTRYYHLDGVTVTTGAQVRAGDPIGIYANQLSQALCQGGHSLGPHLHFALVRDGEYASLKDVALSGYLVHPGERSYDRNPDEMWLEKRGRRYYAFGAVIGQQPGDNAIDYRYNGMWYSPAHTGHGMNIEIMEMPAANGSRNTVFIAVYTYDDAGEANFYVGNRDFDRWRPDETMVIPLAQTAGGDMANFSPIDFDNPGHYQIAGQVGLLFQDCNTVWVELQVLDRASGQVAEHVLELVRLIGVPSHVCEAASLPVPSN